MAKASPETLVRYHVERGSRQNFAAVSYKWLPSPELIGGQRGTSALAEVKRGDGLADFAYVAAAYNAYYTAESTPYLLVSVIRNQKRARGKPVSKEFIRELGHKIAASLQKEVVNIPLISCHPALVYCFERGRS